MSRTAGASALPAIEELSRLDRDAFANAVALLFERAPLLSKRLWEARPFRSYDELLERARSVVGAMSETEKIAILDAHPRIGERRERLSEASRREQASVDPSADRELAELNARYETRFGFRFVVFVAGRSRAEIARLLRHRLAGSREAELATGIAEFLAIAADRLAKAT